MKRIITCCDGTWNTPGETQDGIPVPTNVEKIASLICTTDAEGISQLTHYHPGVGTSGNIFQKLLGGISGDGLDADILDAYKFIVLNYEEGDHNYLFGFSRGAYTARSLGGFIVNCGILKKENIHMLNQAFRMYRDRTDATHPNSETSQQFRAAYSHPPAVYFIGVWDTVGDLGIPLAPLELLNADKYKFHDVQLSSIVPYAYHAMAVDEHRKTFNITFWQRSDKAIADNDVQTIEQVWFAGAHSNVGGGYADRGLSDHSLQWMIGKAKGAGLSFNEPDADFYRIDYIKGALVNTNTSIWWALSGFKDFYRTITLNDPVYINQAIDASVCERKTGNITYTPHNIAPGICEPVITAAVPAVTDSATAN